MASGLIDEAREIQRYSEGKVYRRKVFKGIKINPNIEDTVVKEKNIPTTIVTVTPLRLSMNIQNWRCWGMGS